MGDVLGDGALRREARSRGDRLSLRLTQKEKSGIVERAGEAGCTVTDYVVARALSDASSGNLPTRSQFREALVELRRQGANLNQLSRAANALVNEVRADDADGAAIAQSASRVYLMSIELRRSLGDAYDSLGRALDAAWPRG